MAFQRIGILSIGEMGYHWARILTSRGVEVLTYAKDRSETTRKRAETIGVKCLPSMNRLVRDADLIVSIVVPFAAKRVASKVAKATAKLGRKDLLYLDANAISPMTADEIAKTLTAIGVNFVDGCIIGSAAKMDELKRTFNHYGMDAFMAPAVKKVLQSIAALEIGKASETGARDGDLLGTVELFFQKGLLQNSSNARATSASPSVG